MKKVERNEVLGLADYEVIRERFRTRVIEEKRRRRLNVGDRMSVLFENHDTVLLQIQEMLRTERITKEAGIRHEIETYNELVPGDAELSCTLFLEVDDPAERAAFLRAMKGFEAHLYVVVGGERFGATWDPTRMHEDHASAVNYFKFPLSGSAVDGLKKAARGEAGAPVVELAVTHPTYPRTATLSRATLASLAEDFEP